MKRVVFSAILFLISSTAFSQYANSWINYGQQYYYFKISREGIYRIDSAALAGAGIPLSTIDARNFQVFGRGKELPVYVQGENDGVLNASDFIEFYAQPNNGWLDADIYDSPANQPNPHYSLFNDTATYYLAWNTSTANLRAAVETDVVFSSYTPSPYFFKEDYYKPGNYGYSLTYFLGQSYVGTFNPNYSANSGWYDRSIENASSRTINFNTSQAYLSGPSATVTSVVSGQSDAPNNSPDQHLQVSYGSGTVVYDVMFNGYQQHNVNFSIPPSSISSTTAVTVTSVGLSPAPPIQRLAIGHITLKYPHTYNLEGLNTFKLYVPDDAQGKTYLKASSFSASSAVLYDVTNGRRITTVFDGTDFNALIPNAGGEKMCFISDEGFIQSSNKITNLKPVSSTAQFTDFSAQSGNYVIVTHPSLMAEAQQYAAYRDIMGYNVVLADVEELYHQFAYGVVKHPLAVRNLAAYTLAEWSEKPEHLFLIGKSIHAHLARSNPSLFIKNLVPSIGNVATDNFLTAGLSGTLWEPAIPTGRLAAQFPADVSSYYNKVVQYENPQYKQQPEEWMKRVLHFSGGADAQQQKTLAGYLKNYENIIEDTLFGGHVYTFSKNTAGTIQEFSPPTADSIKGLIEGGVALMTFFAHAYGSSFDVSMSRPADYNNNGKYPLILANSCLVGDIHANTGPGSYTTSEDFVLIPGKGSIGFIASTGTGFIGFLNTYSEELYRKISAENYGGSIGKNIQLTIRGVQDAGALVPYKANIAGMTLHGDPAISLYSQPLPDIMLKKENVFTTPSFVSTSQDSFDLNVIVTNLGRAINKPFNVEVIRKFPDGTTETQMKSLPGAYFKDTMAFTFAVDKAKGAGFNVFSIYGDASSEIEEINELNNNIESDILINTDDIVPVYPYKFAVTGSQGVKLKASTGNPFAPARNYLFQLDTTDKFIAPIETATINHSGGVVVWEPQTLKNMPDSAVYYWRVCTDVTPDTSRKWKESSFQYIKDKYGWGQAHFYQFKEDNFNLINYRRDNLKFEFDTMGKVLTAFNIGNPTGTEYGKIEYLVDFVRQEYDGCTTNPSLHVAVIDPVTLKPWGKKWTDASGITHNPDHNFGNANNESSCRNRIEKYFIFRTADSVQMAGMNDMLLNKIPDDHYILVYSFVRSMASQWGDNLTSTFSALGGSGLDTTMPDTRPFIFFVKKGDISTAQTIIGATDKAQIQLNAQLKGILTYGEITSSLVGPAKKWGSLHMRAAHLEAPTKDSVNVQVIGVKKDGQEMQLAAYAADAVDVLNLETIADAKVYPYLKLNIYKRDDSLQTAPQLRRWQVLYDAAPEAALNASIAYAFHNPQIQEGENIKFTMAVQNISEFGMDSLNISYALEDAGRVKKQLFYGKKSPLPADSILISEIEFSSNGYEGAYNLWLEVNPRDQNWQLEQYHFNNVAFRSFTVTRDNINPLLDVTFDGVRILNRDIVSPKPVIVIQLTDESKFMLMNSDADTSQFAVYIKDPNGMEKRIWFRDNTGNEVMRFYPASGEKNNPKIEYKGSFPVDGIYRLRVQASDKSNNRSGDADYTIEFEVINKSTITEVLNYPNPFSTFTQFVFTLTGSEIPDQFMIQILTVTGKVVREIMQHELGPIRIGRNRSEYRWNGTDEFGDPLANGIYLYRVVTKINGNDIEHRATNADQYFHKGFGKMYLMR